MNTQTKSSLDMPRRYFFGRSAHGLGVIALAKLLGDDLTPFQRCARTFGAEEHDEFLVVMDHLVEGHDGGIPLQASERIPFYATSSRETMQ